MRRSLWQERHSIVTAPAGRRAAPTTTGDVEGRWDVVVVGAGITGLTTAVLLGRAGLSVLVVEARTVGCGTTGGSTAKLSLLQGTQLSTIARHHPASVLRDYVAANRDAQAWLTAFCSDHEVEVQRRTAYTYATTASGEHAARRELEHARSAGLEASWVDDVPLPFATRGALALPDQCQLDPVELLLALRDELLGLGGRLVEGARVTRVRGRSPITVVTERGTATAGTVVVATNTPVLDRGGFFARLTAARSYSLAFRTTPATPSSLGMFLSTDQPSRSLRDATGAAGEQLLLVGGNGHVTGRARSPLERLDEIRSWTHDYFGPLDEVAAWSAQDYQPHHGLPYAGPLLPGRRDLLVGGGYSKWGMTNGVAAAHVLAASVTDATTPHAATFATWSPRELTGLPAAGKANAEVGLALTTGWLRPIGHLGRRRPPAEGAGEVAVDRAATPTAASTVDGVARRVSAVCTHLGGIVAWNDAERSWDCPLHGSRFDADGSVLEGVATCGLAPRRSRGSPDG